MTSAKTLSQVADAIEVSAPTVKTWLCQLDFIPAEKDTAGRWRFPDETEDVLRQIQALRLDGRTMNTVRRRFNDGSTGVEQDQGEQAERYARATYRVGDLEATVRAVEADRDRLASELADARPVNTQLEAPKAEPQPARPWWKVWG